MSYSPFYFDQQSTGSAVSIVTNYTNASIVNAIPQGMAVSVTGSGLIVPLDVTSQASWQAFVGYATVRIPASGNGPVVANGRLPNFVTSYTAGTALYIGTDSNPTSIIPSAGVNSFVEGDIVIFLGVLVPNETNPSALDIALFTQFVDVL
jgi:hypothetical protein